MYKVNLLPDELIQPGVDFKKALRTCSAVLLFVVISVSYGFFLYQLSQSKTELARLQKNAADRQPELELLESLKKQRTELEKAASDLDGIVDNRVTWSPIIAEINSNVPADVFLTALRIYCEGIKTSEAERQVPGDGRKGITAAPPVPNTVSIQGESRSVLPVGVFVNGLLKVEYFSEVRINDIHENQEKGTLAFSITALVSGGRH